MTGSRAFRFLEALLLPFFKDNQNFTHPQSGVQETILIPTYVAIILSISVTISSLSPRALGSGAAQAPHSIVKEPPSEGSPCAGSGLPPHSSGALLRMPRRPQDALRIVTSCLAVLPLPYVPRHQQILGFHIVPIVPISTPGKVAHFIVLCSTMVPWVYGFVWVYGLHGALWVLWDSMDSMGLYGLYGVLWVL